MPLTPSLQTSSPALTNKLNKQQKRRIRANYASKLSDSSHHDSAIVVAHFGYQIIVSHQDRLIPADWRKQIGTIACNDRVLISHTDDNRAMIEAVLPRQNTLFKWAGRKLKPLTSHIDQLLIVIAIKPEWQSSLLDRYIIAAQESNIDIAILCNKLDLADKDCQQQTRQRLQPYADLKHPIFYTSLTAQADTTALKQWLAGKQTVICGQSGVGKSSLVSHLIPDVDIWIQAISAATELGRHTTTNLRRYPYGDNGAIIDTPGVRGFAIGHLSSEAIISGFADIAPFTQRCKFNDCSHRHEPDCAVLAALEAGEIHPQRYHSLMQLLDEQHSHSH